MYQCGFLSMKICAAHSNSSKCFEWLNSLLILSVASPKPKWIQDVFFSVFPQKGLYYPTSFRISFKKNYLSFEGFTAWGGKFKTVAELSEVEWVRAKHPAHPKGKHLVLHPSTGTNAVITRSCSARFKTSGRAKSPFRNLTDHMWNHQNPH